MSPTRPTIPTEMIHDPIGLDPRKLPAIIYQATPSHGRVTIAARVTCKAVTSSSRLA
jgi:hypothetical protein